MGDFLYEIYYYFYAMAKQQKITLRNGEEISLSERELLFCEYYLGEADRNGAEAAKMAGFSVATAKHQASRLLTKVNLKKYLEDKTAPVLEALGFTVERALKEWAQIAFSTPNEQLTKDSPIPLGYDVNHKFKTLTIEGVEVDSYEKTVNYKTESKIKALTVISEHLGIIDRKTAAIVNGNEQPQQVINLFQQINQYLGGK